MSMDDECDGERDHNGNHHEPSLQIFMRTIPKNLQTPLRSEPYALNSQALPVMCLEKKVLVVEQIGAALVDDDQVGCAEDDQVDGLQG